MKAKLFAFGRFLEGEYEVYNNQRDKIYLIHRVLSDYRFAPDEPSTVPEKKVAYKAVFEWRGKYVEKLPIYEFMGLE